MVDQNQALNLQQPGATGGASTSNPQQIGQTNLQTPGGANLQITSNQSISSLNQLDQGGAPISINGIANTTVATVQPASTSSQKTISVGKTLMYGGVVIVVAGIMAGMIYSLLRQR